MCSKTFLCLELSVLVRVLCLGVVLISPLSIQFTFGHGGISENLKLGKERSRNSEKAFSGSVWKMFFSKQRPVEWFSPLRPWKMKGKAVDKSCFLISHSNDKIIFKLLMAFNKC